MNGAELFAEVIKKGISRPEEVKQDLILVLASVRDHNNIDGKPEKTDALLSQIRTILTGNPLYRTKNVYLIEIKKYCENSLRSEGRE